MTIQSKQVLVIRRAQGSDIPALARLSRLATGGLIDALYEGLPLEPRFERVGSVTSSANAAVAVMVERVVGMVHFYPVETARIEGPDPAIPLDRLTVLEPFRRLDVPGTLYVAAIAVEPRFQRKGIGSRLLTYVQEKVAATGLGRVSLHVFAENKPAVQFYAARGFEVVGRQPVVPHRLLRFSGEVLAMAGETQREL